MMKRSINVSTLAILQVTPLFYSTTLAAAYCEVVDGCVCAWCLHAREYRGVAPEMGACISRESNSSFGGPFFPLKRDRS